jgi:CBS domain-containing protein
MVALSKVAVTRPDTVLWSALEKMGRDGVNQLPVVEGNGVVGVLSREDPTTCNCCVRWPHRAS